MKEARRLFPRIVCVGLIMALGPELPGQSSHYDYQPPVCGLNSLYMLMQIYRRPTSLEVLERSLPARHTLGYSMAELRAAAVASGLHLEGETFTQANVPLDRLAIAHLRTHKPGGGHFVVLRPIGQHGLMVQVLERPFAPRAVDYADLLRANDGSLDLLIPRSLAERYGTSVGRLAALVGVVALLFLMVGGPRWVRAWSRSSRVPHPSTA